MKQAAPELGVSTSYLSKLETGKIAPSEATLDRLAAYYAESRDELGVLAGRLPADITDILRNQPDEAIRLLREKFGGG